MSRRWHLAQPVLLALEAAAVVIVDPLVSPLLPHALWRMTGLVASPLQLTPILLVVALAGLALGRVSRRWPAFPLSACIALLLAAQMNGLRSGPFDLFDLALAVVFLVWLATRALDTDRPIFFPPLLVAAGMLVLIAILHLAIQNPVRWFIGTFGIVRAALVAFLMIDLVRDLATLNRALRAFLVLAVASAVVGIVQFMLAYLGIYVFTLISPPETAFKPTPIGYVMRASALCITAQHYSSFLVYALPIGLWRLADRRRWRDLLAVGLILTGILVSWNFGAVIVAMVLTLVFPFLRWPHLSLHFALAIVAVMALAWFTGLWQVLYDLSFGDAGVAKGVSQRHTLFGLGLEKISRNPLVGTGPQGFAAYDGNFWGRPVHNAFGQAATELGVAGAVVLGAAFFWLVGRLASASLTDGARRAPAAILLLMVLAALQLAQSEPNLDHVNTWLVLGLGQALLLIRQRDPDGTS
ncbi:O-antigen ligase family protein [Rhodobacter ferrooxidans]|nr:hypothetical protein [Rhodobacter sp. SW2]